MPFAVFAIASFAIYDGALPPTGVALVAALALGAGGLAPGALYASAPQAAPSPAAVPATIGLLQQASNLGQFAGPAGGVVPDQSVTPRIANAAARPIKAAGATIVGAVYQPECAIHTPSATGPAN